MRCKRCGAYLTVGNERNDPVGGRTLVEAMAWAKDEFVKCWRCGQEYRPTHKPSDRPRLQMRPTPTKLPGLRELYRALKAPWEPYRKVRGRKVA